MKFKNLLPIIACVMLLVGGANIGLAQQPFVSQATRFAESIPVREMQASKPSKNRGADREINEQNEIPIKQMKSNGIQKPDEVLFTGSANKGGQTINTLNPPTVNFDGIGVNGSAPPDCNGEAGLNHYVQTVNSRFQIWDKAGTSLVGPLNISSLFASLGAPASNHDDGDPIVLYDQLADRWIISQFLISVLPYRQLIAVSKTGDPTGAYYLYNFTMPANQLNDYPHFGVWPDGYYMTDNQFLNGSTFSGAGCFAFDRAKMLVGDPTATYIYFGLTNIDGGLLPSDLDGYTPPPAGSPNVFMEFDTDILKMWNFHADFTTPANSTFTPLSNSPLAVPHFNFLLTGIPQLGTTQKLDNLADRLMFRLSYRNLGSSETLVLNHTVDAGSSRAGVRFYQMSRTSTGSPYTLFQSATFAPGTEHRWMGSAAINFQGDIALGYAVSSSAMNPSIRYTARATTDALGTFQTEQTIFNGTGSQLSNLSRWGDYSDMTVDPSDDCSFWYTQEYLATNGTFNWHTRIAKIAPFATAVSPRGIISGTVTNCVTGLPIANAFIQISNGTSRATLANGSYSAIVIPGTYTATVTASGFSSIVSGSLIVSNGGAVTFNASMGNCNPPSITTNGTLNPFSSCAGAVSAEQTFTVSGTNLTANLVVTAPTGFEVSTTTGSGFGASVSLVPVSGTVSATTFFARLKATATGNPSGNMACTSTGATTKNVAATGTVNSLPLPAITGTLAFCTGGSTTLSTGVFNTYLWSNGITTQSVSISTAGTYTVTVANAAGCIGTKSAVVVKNNNPSVTITPASVSVCVPSTSVVITASGTSTAYAWSPAATLNQTTGASVTATPTATTIYTVTGSNAAGCTATKTSKVTVNPKPTNLSTTNITASGATTNWTTVACASGYTVQYKTAASTIWTAVQVNTNVGFKTLTGLLPNTPYNWRIKTKFSNGTTTTYTNPVNFTTLVVRQGELPATSDLNLYPNPSKGSVTIQLNDCENCTYTVSVFDVLGHKVFTEKGKADGDTKTIDLSHLAKGIYQVEASYNDVTNKCKLVMQ